MIRKIRLEGITSYKEAIEIADLKKLNFFYGNNGSGKSTIGKYLYHLIASEDKKYLNISLCHQTGFESEKHELLIFDEKFIERNFIEKENLNGIFSLDEKNEEIDIIINAELEKIIANDAFTTELEDSINNLLEKKQKAFTTLKALIFRKRDLFKDFSKLPLKHSGNSGNHFIEISKVLEEKKHADISFSDINTSYLELFETELSEIQINIDSTIYKSIRVLELKINKVLDTVIVGNQDVDIASMIERLNIKKWVEEGISHIDKTLEKQDCPFCQEETITTNLIVKFEEYFDETYKD